MKAGKPSISLHFAGQTPVLQKTIFIHPDESEPISAERAGRNYPRNRQGRWFTWTAAVRAISVLLVREKARFLGGRGNGSVTEAELTGGKGSLAASLREARYKNMEAKWAVNVFGAEPRAGKDDQCRLQILFNSQVDGDGWKVTVGPNALPAQNISVTWNGIGLDNIGDLERLANLIERDTSDSADDTSDSPDDEERIQTIGTRVRTPVNTKSHADSAEVLDKDRSALTTTGAKVSPKERDLIRKQRNEIVCETINSMQGVLECFVMQLEDHSDKGYLLHVKFDPATTCAANLLSGIRSKFTELFEDVPIWGESLTEGDETVSFGFAWIDPWNKVFNNA